MQSSVVPGSYRDPVAVQIKCGEVKNLKDVVVRSAYFPSDSMEIPPHTEFKELMECCSDKKLEFPAGSETNAHQYGVARTST